MSRIQAFNNSGEDARASGRFKSRKLNVCCSASLELVIQERLVDARGRDVAARSLNPINFNRPMPGLFLHSEKSEP
jgi:hypothetical protein